MNRRARTRTLALLLFTLYCVLYGTFVLVAAFGTFHEGKATGGLSREAFAGLSWGVVGGFGLIVGAFLLALAYAFVARDEETGS
ncbi:MAG: hypothetical protein QM516_10525 [Limnohabitans sp.]|jgi:uncharacterized membrane protein (DUF485 family)|nr:hypothetical protein [Limnohabitans sp.]